MTNTNAILIAQAWQDAANTQQLERLRELSHPNIELVGPRGAGYGFHLLVDWVSRAGLTLQTQDTYAKDGDIVMVQHGVWRSVDTGAVVGEAEVATYYCIEGARVTRIARYETPEGALQEAGLTEQDKVLNDDDAMAC